MIIQFLLNGAVVFLTSKVIPGVQVRSFGYALAVAAVYGLLGVALKWFVVMVTFPAVILSFGLFLLVINGVLLWMTDKLLDGFEVRTPAAMVLATIAISSGYLLVDIILH